MRLFSELKRRNVFRMAALYLVAAWLVMQVADVILDRPRGAVPARQHVGCNADESIRNPDRRAAQALDEDGQHLRRHSVRERALEPGRA